MRAAGWAGAGEEVAGLEVGEAGGGVVCGVDVGDCLCGGLGVGV